MYSSFLLLIVVIVVVVIGGSGGGGSENIRHQPCGSCHFFSFIIDIIAVNRNLTYALQMPNSHYTLKRNTNTNTKKKKRKKKSHEPWAYEVSPVFWIHIKLKFGPHKRGKSEQLQILYKFKIQFNYWINFKFSSNGKQHFFQCECCWDCKLYNSNKNFRANLIRMAVCRMGDSIFFCWGSFEA